MSALGRYYIYIESEVMVWATSEDSDPT